VREPAAAGREETPSPRRSARTADSSLGPTVPDDPATGADGPADETALTRPVRPMAEPTGGASGDGPDPTPRFSPRRAARTGQTGETPPVALAAVPTASPGRAGRNLPAAVGVGVALAGLVLASLLVRKEAFVLVITAAILVALWELAGALRTKRIEVPVVPLGVGALGMLVSAFVAGEDGLLVSFALTAFGVLLWRIIDGHDGATRDVAASVFVAAYVPFLAGFALLMLAMPDGALRVLTFIAVTVSNDIGGYATGVLAGRHPMAPTISPKKSWEGMAGSMVLCMVVGAATVHYLLDGSILAGLAVGAAAAITATIGDLSESLIKRDLGIKDMGNLLPGHGGIMDRLDSLLPTAPAAYLLLLLLVPVVR
jgi:CDP-diglyceride synthetase